MRSLYALHRSLPVAIPAIPPRLRLSGTNRLRFALHGGQRWRGRMDKLLPKPSRVRTVTHHPAMTHTEVPAFMADLVGNRSVSVLTLRFLILTATRTSAVLQAEWPEIDLEAAVWTIPAARMKARREHRVPLSASATSCFRC